MITIKTNHGDISVELFDDKAPISCENFLKYAKDGHYTGTIFHRVIPNFMIQGGGFDTDMQQKSTKAPIENEADNGLKNDFGTIAMARTPDPHSARVRVSAVRPRAARQDRTGHHPASGVSRPGREPSDRAFSSVSDLTRPAAPRRSTCPPCGCRSPRSNRRPGSGR